MVEEKLQKKQHGVEVQNRERLSLTGVTDVIDFDSQHVSVTTDYGSLTVKGEGLKIGKLSVDIGEITVEGEIEALFYSEDSSEKRGVFSRLFK